MKDIFQRSEMKKDCLLVKSDYILPLMLPYLTADSNKRKKKKSLIFPRNISLSQHSFTEKSLCFSSDGASDLS